MVKFYVPSFKTDIELKKFWKFSIKERSKSVIWDMLNNEKRYVSCRYITFYNIPFFEWNVFISRDDMPSDYGNTRRPAPPTGWTKK